MTTNNHPANGPVSLERLHQIRETLSKAAAQSDGGNIGYAMADAVKVINGVLESMAREQVLREHAAWSQATFGDVGPVGPLKHLSKESLEAAAEPGDLSEWADMQFLLWDAQRRAGISDEQITQAMVEKLAVNKQREWPEPKDGEPRLHIKEQPAPVVPEYPETLPCPVLLEPGMRFGKGVKTRLVLEAIQRRAEHYAELEAMTPEQRAEHDAGIEAIKAMLPKPAQPDIEMLASALTNAPLAPSDSQGRQRAPVVPNSENGLMPCPFCGGKAHQLTIEQDDDPHFGGDVITCTECWASSHVEFGFKENLKSAWNSRTAMLQAGNHTEQHLDMVGRSGDANEKVDFRLPFYQWLSQQNEPIDLDCGCVTTEAFFHWLRVAYEAGNSPVIPDCWCHTCRPVTMGDMRFVVCPECGNKRCPHANDHRHACTGSNEPGQEGSAYPAAPQQEVKNV